MCEASCSPMTRSQSFSEPVPWAVTFRGSSQSHRLSFLVEIGRLEGAGVGHFPNHRPFRLWKNPSQLGSGKVASPEDSSPCQEEQNALVYFKMAAFSLPMLDA